MLEIIGKTQIHESELLFKASRSSGPGGQNVNKLNTRMTLLFDVAGSPGLSDEQKRRVRTGAGNAHRQTGRAPGGFAAIPDSGGQPPGGD